MRRPRNFQTDRCYHLVNQVGHRAFYLDEYEPWHEVTPPLPLHQWGQTLGDGTHIIYVNGATRSETEIGKLVHDLLCRDAAKMHFDVLKRQVSKFKNSEEGRRYMCKAMEEFGNRREAHGEARGKRETMLATAKRMLKDGILALKDIARYSGLTLAQVKKLQAEMA